MPPLNRDHTVHRPFTLNGGKLTFECGAGQLAYFARQAMDAGQDFTVHLAPPEGAEEVTGKVQSVELVKGAKPIKYEIVMRVTKERD